MPQLDITTYFTQSFWLIIIFLITYINISNKYLPRLSYVIKYRREYQEERDWTLISFNNEIGIYKNILLEYNSQKKRIRKILSNYNQILNTLNNELTTYTNQCNKVTMNKVLRRKYEILIEINLRHE